MSKSNAEAAAQAANKVILASLKEWKELTDWLTTAKSRELELRVKLAEAFIPEALRKEGVNAIVVDGLEIKVDHKINRTIDEAALEAIMPQLPESYQQLGVLIEYKPRLVMDGFRALQLQEDSLMIFAQAVTEKVGTPALTITDLMESDAPAPKQAAKKAGKKGKKK